MKGYKAFDKDLKCRDFQYEIGKTYELGDEPIVCKQGFHFCVTIDDCYLFYPMFYSTRICEIEAVGDVVTSNNIKYCTNKIKIIREIEEPWIYSNIGHGNTGNSNEGNYNSGHYWNASKSKKILDNIPVDSLNHSETIKIWWDNLSSEDKS